MVTAEGLTATGNRGEAEPLAKAGHMPFRKSTRRAKQLCTPRPRSFKRGAKAQGLEEPQAVHNLGGEAFLKQKQRLTEDTTSIPGKPYIRKDAGSKIKTQTQGWGSVMSACWACMRPWSDPQLHIKIQRRYHVHLQLKHTLKQNKNLEQHIRGTSHKFRVDARNVSLLPRTFLCPSPPSGPDQEHIHHAER